MLDGLLAVLVLAATACHPAGRSVADPASKAGYLTAYLPGAPSYVVSGPHAYNSAGGSITVTRSSAGRYSIVFAGLADQGGVAQVQAAGPRPNFCLVLRWIPDGPDEVVTVSCYTAGTDPADTLFTASFAAGAQPGAVFSYLWADEPTNPGRYPPSPQYRHDSTGRDAWVQRVSTGRYRVWLPAADGIGDRPAAYQVTAYGSAVFRCALRAVGSPGTPLEVSCRDGLGTLFDARFALSFAAAGSLLGRTDRPTFAGDARTATRTGPGLYRIVAPGLGADRGQTVVVATGSAATDCHIDHVATAGPDLAVTVRCYGPRGAPADSTFSVGATG